MKIKKMTATFGCLDNDTITPGEGLTVFTAPNEAGKSTWAAFLRVMLYGLDTRDRDKAGYLADKNRYAPWSGAPMSGEIELEWNGRDITIRRSSNRSGPMQQFAAVYTATGDPVPGLTAANVGQQLLGAGRDVFVRTALVGQNSAAVTAAPELESRIAALATSGQEDVSFSATQRTLKDWRNRRRSNRSNGLIPQLEYELAQTEQALNDMTQARTRRELAQARLEQLTAQLRDLEVEQELHRRLAGKELNRRYGEALSRLDAAKEELAQMPQPDPAFAGMTAQQAREAQKTMEQQREETLQKQQQSEEKAALCRRRDRLRTIAKILIPLLAVGGLLLTVIGFVLSIYPMAFGGVGCMAAAVVAFLILVSMMGRTDKAISAITAEKVILPPVADAEPYIQWLSRKDMLEQEVRHCQERADDLAAQGAQPLNTLELLPQPVHSPGETSSLLARVQADITQCRSQLDQAIGALSFDPTELESRRSYLEDQRSLRMEEYDALDLALGALESANAALRERFSPALNQEAAAIFSQLTGGKYSALTLSRDFSAMAGGADKHSSLYLSTGTTDQLYLAVRLALCSMTLPQSPILLDDALCACDDGRMAQSLGYLASMGKERQILLFSCQNREAEWARQNGVPAAKL